MSDDISPLHSSYQSNDEDKSNELQSNQQQQESLPLEEPVSQQDQDQVVQDQPSIQAEHKIQPELTEQVNLLMSQTGQEQLANLESSVASQNPETEVKQTLNEDASQQKKAPTFRLTKKGSVYVENQKKVPEVFLDETPISQLPSSPVQEESLDKVSEILEIKALSEVNLSDEKVENIQVPTIEPQVEAAPRKKISLFRATEPTQQQNAPSQPAAIQLSNPVPAQVQPEVLKVQPKPMEVDEIQPAPQAPAKAPLIQLKAKPKPEEELAPPLIEAELQPPKSKISFTKPLSPKMSQTIDQINQINAANTENQVAQVPQALPIQNTQPDPLQAANLNLAQVLAQQANIQAAVQSQIPPIQQNILSQMSLFPQSAPQDNEQSFNSKAGKRDDSVNFAKFYDLKKRVLTLELNTEQKSLEKAQIIFELALHDEAEQNLKELQNDAALEFSFHSKQVQIKDIHLLRPKDGLTENQVTNHNQLTKEKALVLLKKLPCKPIFNKKKLKLGKPEDQAKYQEEVYFNLNRNLIQMEEVEKLAYKLQLEQGTHKLKRERPLSIKKDEPVSQLKSKIWFLVEYSCKPLADVGGIRLARYLQDREDLITTGRAASTCDNINDHRMRQAILFHTTDLPEQSLCWMPSLVGMHRTETDWILNFIVPKEYLLIASGQQVHHVEDAQGKALYKYECSSAIADKVGFICCPNPHRTIIESKKQSQLRQRQVQAAEKSTKTAYFVSKQKQKEFGDGHFINEICDDMTSLLAQNSGSYPTQENSLVFVPNLFSSKDLKQSYDFAGGLHIFDQFLLHKSNQIEKRHKTYKHIASSLAFDYFGAQVTEKQPSDVWLLQAIRERFGDRYKKHKCGTYMYRYYVHKQINKLYTQISKGIEGGPLQNSAKNINPDTLPELNRLGQQPCEQMLSDIFLRKCSLLMHMFESTVSERDLNTIIKEMYKEAKDENQGKLEGDMLYKKCRKVFGKDRSKDFFDNWIWSTSCPKIELSYDFNKRHNQIDLTVKQTSAIQNYYKFRECLEGKMSTIFGKKGNEMKRSIYQDLLVQNHSSSNMSVNSQKILDCLDAMDDVFPQIDQSRACKRWFTGNLNIMIYQVDGSSGDILAQHYKLKLQNFKTKVDVHIPLDGKVKRTMQNKRRDIYDTYLTENILSNSHKQGGPQMQRPGMPNHRPGMPHNSQMNASQPMLNQDVWKFEMNEFELEDFPQDTKNIFQNRELDNNPVLWIRVDPDMEYIRKVTVVQEKRNNWLFQLLREKDIIGQIEAVKALKNYNQSTVYEILKTVARNENYFVKVRQQVVKTLGKMQIGQFNEHMSHEMYLLKFFNRKNFDEESGFYKPNNFGNLLEYLMDKTLIKALSKCKESKLQLTSEKQKELEQIRKFQKPSPFEETKDKAQEQKDDNEASYASKKSDTGSQRGSKKFKFTVSKGSQPGRAGVGGGVASQKQLEAEISEALKKQFPDKVKESDFRTTTDTVANMLFKVLEQSDNSENKFDDSFYIGHLLASLGRLDNFSQMPVIAEEVLRQFKLDQISNSSPQFSISMGAIEAYFNMRKQIYKFKTIKINAMDKDAIANQNNPMTTGGQMPFENENQEENQKTINETYIQKVKETEVFLDEMHVLLKSIFRDPYSSLQLKLFIFKLRVKEIFLYSELNFIRALKITLDTIYEIQNDKQPQQQVKFSIQCLKLLTLYLEGPDFMNKMNFTELYNNKDPENFKQMKTLFTTIWELFICHPCNFLTSELSFWAKRMINRLYGTFLPDYLQQEYILSEDQYLLQKKRQEKYSDQVKTFNYAQDRKWVKTAPELLKEAQTLEEKRQNAIQNKDQEEMMKTEDRKSPRGGETRLRFDVRLKESNKEGSKLAIPNRLGESKPQQNQGKISFSLGQKRANQDQSNILRQQYETNQRPSQPNRSLKITFGGPRNDRSASAISGFENSDGGDQHMDASFLSSVSMADINKDIDGKQDDSYNNSDQDGNSQRNEDDESREIDPFADEVYQGFYQPCWLALGELYYHYEATEFLDISPQTLGQEMYENYMEEIETPMCITWVMEKIRKQQYNNKDEFLRDVEQIFKNCFEFNEADSEIYQSARQLKFFFKQQCREKGV